MLYCNVRHISVYCRMSVYCVVEISSVPLFDPFLSSHLTSSFPLLFPPFPLQIIYECTVPSEKAEDAVARVGEAIVCPPGAAYVVRTYRPLLLFKFLYDCNFDCTVSDGLSRSSLSLWHKHSRSHSLTLSLSLSISLFLPQINDLKARGQIDYDLLKSTPSIQLREVRILSY